MLSRTECELSAMGIVEPQAGGFLLTEFILARQAVTPMSVDLDMDWWADQQVELFEKRGIEPWQTSCWCHTHPAGVNEPSTQDEETMEGSFGSWDFIVMLILTKEGRFYGRVDCDHRFGSGGRHRLQLPAQVQVDWAACGEQGIDDQTILGWEVEFQERVEAMPHSMVRSWGNFDPLWDWPEGWDEYEDVSSDPKIHSQRDGKEVAHESSSDFFFGRDLLRPEIL